MRNFMAVIMFLLGVSASGDELIAARDFGYGKMLALMEGDSDYTVSLFDNDRDEVVIDTFFHLTPEGDLVKVREAKEHAMEWYHEYEEHYTGVMMYTKPRYTDGNGKVYKVCYRYHPVFLDSYGYLGLFELSDGEAAMVLAEKFRGKYSLLFRKVRGDSIRLVTGSEEDVHEALSMLISCRYAPTKEQFVEDMLEYGKGMFDRLDSMDREICDTDTGKEYVIYVYPPFFINDMYKSR